MAQVRVSSSLLLNQGIFYEVVTQWYTRAVGYSFVLVKSRPVAFAFFIFHNAGRRAY